MRLCCGHGAARLALAAFAGGVDGADGEPIEGAGRQVVGVEAALGGDTDELPLERVVAGAHVHVVHFGPFLGAPHQGGTAAVGGEAGAQVAGWVERGAGLRTLAHPEVGGEDKVGIAAAGHLHVTLPLLDRIAQVALGDVAHQVLGAPFVGRHRCVASRQLVDERLEGFRGGEG